MQELTLIKYKMRPAPTSNEKIKTPEQASLVIQKMWRGQQSRRATKSKKIAEMILIGMVTILKGKSKVMLKIVARCSNSH
jgi:hypothetical protein